MNSPILSILHCIFLQLSKFITMEDPKHDLKGPEPGIEPRVGEDVAVGIHDESAIPQGTLDPVYEAKARVLNHAIQDIGMGRYQWALFVTVGFGWAADNFFPIMTSLIFTPIVNEFAPSRPPLLQLAQNIGLLVSTSTDHPNKRAACLFPHHRESRRNVDSL